MALYTGRLDLADAIMAPLVSDRADGLWPTVVVDERGVALGLVYSSRESVREAVRRRMGVYQSRSRGLWVKGETSGATQDLIRIDLDCDRDSPRFVVRQRGPGFCHLDTRTCWGEDAGLGRLERTLASRKAAAPEGSYTAKLLADPALLGAKLREEAGELAEAGGARTWSGKRRTCSTSPSPGWPPRGSTSPRSRRTWTAGRSRCRGGGRAWRSSRDGSWLVDAATAAGGAGVAARAGHARRPGPRRRLRLGLRRALRRGPRG
jgi:phosphoribosyl-AMP cyclohydrolase